MLSKYKTKRNTGWLMAALWLGSLSLMSVSAYALKGVVKIQGMSLAEARNVFAADFEGTEIPLTVNNLVLDRINHYIGTEKGREYLKQSRTRMIQYQPMVERKMIEYNMPKDLIALPMWESGYRNDVVSNGMGAKGIWQFIAQTARRYDLVVNDKVDERLDPEKETDAAMRYLRDLFNRFQDWRLALKSYNEGEHRVERLIAQYHTRDAWELERLDSKENYLSGAIAIMLLQRHPELLK